jgi:uncharacterized protein
MSFKSIVFIIPGLGNSEDDHWQTLWQKKFNFIRIDQKEWETPTCKDWIETLDRKVSEQDLSRVILVGHSLACATIAAWAARFNRKIKGALLVGPSDVDAATYPPGTTGFTPMPLNKLPFPSITVASTDDYYVTQSRAEYFAKSWGSDLVNIGAAGHINVAAGFGPWEKGLDLLRKLDG